MLSTVDLESLIAVKRLEIEKEKTALGLTPPQTGTTDKENATAKRKKQVRVEDRWVLRENNDTAESEKERDSIISHRLEDNVPAGLERYIRRYIGLPVMLKAGEYSPNNPLIRGERTSGDALFGLGEYDRRRHTLRKLRQQQYREYLDQQAKKKQQDKEQAEKEQREREERERQRDEELRERERQREELERERREERESERRCADVRHVPAVPSSAANYSNKNTVDTGVQASGGRPLSVAVQTEEAAGQMSPSSPARTQAERELSPRAVPARARDPRPARSARRRSYGDFAERTPTAAKQACRELRYKPSIFDADAIHLRNLQTEKDAAARRQFYQQELRSQILEQQRIRDERQSREKMLEQAEMRRLEEQLRMLRVAQQRELGQQCEISCAMTENATDYDMRRTELQREIDRERHTLLRTTSQPSHAITRRSTVTSSSDTQHPKRYYFQDANRDDRILPFSTNIPENSIFSPNYDVDSYLRRNLNPAKESLLSNRMDTSDYIENIGNRTESDTNIVVEALIHDRPKERVKVKRRYVPSLLSRNLHEIDETPIPVLKHSPAALIANEERREGVSQGMQIIEDKWKVPAVQKNILKSQPNDEGKNMNILTQLGSIRRQLQLEQLRLDNMLPKDHV